jgi:hypothetical protein
MGIARSKGFLDCYWNQYIKAAEEIGIGLLSWNVWYRTSGYSIGQITAMFPIEHEFIFVFGKKAVDLVPTIPNVSAGKIFSPSDRGADGRMVEKQDRNVVTREKRELGTVIHLSSVHSNADHPAQFPVELPFEYISAFGSDVYDPFTGSGTTLIAAEQLNRRCFGMEIDPNYCDVIVKRWENLTGEEAIRWEG